MSIFSFFPDWSSPISRTQKWLSTVEESLNGAETRKSLLEKNEIAIRYRVLACDERESAALRLWLLEVKTQRFKFPMWTDQVELSSAINIGATALPVTTTLGYAFLAGVKLMIATAYDQYELATVVSVTPSAINLSAPTAKAWPRGAVVVPVLEGRFQQLPTMYMETDMHLSMECELLSTVEPTAISNSGGGNQQSYALVITVDNPVGYWRLNELQGSIIAKCETDSNLNGRYAFSPQLEVTGHKPGDSNKSMRGDGIDDVVYAPITSTPAHLALLDLFTGAIECWFKASGSGIGGIRGLVEINRRVGVGLWSDEIGVVTFGALPPQFLGTGTHYNDGKWHHAVLNFQIGVASGSQLFVDGISLGTFTIPVNPDAASHHPFIFFGHTTWGSDRYHRSVRADLDEIALYGTLLTPLQINAHYAAGQ